MADYIEQIKEMLTNSPIKWVSMAGIQADIIEPCHVKLSMPIPCLHTNHVNTAYAGSIFTLAELTGGAFLQSAYGFDEFVPIVKNAAIKYVKPGTTALSCEVTLTAQEAEERLVPIRERGRGNYPLTIQVLDESSETVAEVNFTYYLLPVTPRQ